MDSETRFAKIEQRLDSNEQRIQSHSDRIRTLEQNFVAETSKLSGLEGEMKEVKATLAEISKTLKSISARDAKTDEQISLMKKWLIRIGIVAVVAFVYMAIKDEKSATAVMALTTSLAKLGI